MARQKIKWNVHETEWEKFPMVILYNELQIQDWFKKLNGKIKFGKDAYELRKREFDNNNSTAPNNFSIRYPYKTKTAKIVIHWSFDFDRYETRPSNPTLKDYLNEYGITKSIGSKFVEGILERLKK